MEGQQRDKDRVWKQERKKKVEGVVSAHKAKHKIIFQNKKCFFSIDLTLKKKNIETIENECITLEIYLDAKERVTFSLYG